MRLTLGARTTGRALTAVLALLVLSATLVGPGQATAAEEGTPVGGQLLGKDGVVVHGQSDVPRLPKVSAKSYVIADADSGAVLAAKDPHGRYRPASTLKILTAITLIPELAKDAKVRPKRRAVAVEGSRVGVVTDMRYSVKDLFLGLLLASGNDAALVLARAAGGLDHTLAMMNDTADRLHAYDTTAKTPNGLDRPGQRSSAYDLALLARNGLEMPVFRDYVSTVRTKFPAPKGKSFWIHNHNDLLTEYKGCIGVKTGYTTKAESTFVGAAKRDGRTIIVTLMHAKPQSWEEDAEALLDWGFAAAGDVRPVGQLVEPGPTASPTPSDSSSDAMRATSGPGQAHLSGQHAVQVDRETDSRIVLIASVCLLALIVLCFGWLLLILPRWRRPVRYRGHRRCRRHRRQPDPD